MKLSHRGSPYGTWKRQIWLHEGVIRELRSRRFRCVRRAFCTFEDRKKSGVFSAYRSVPDEMSVGRWQSPTTRSLVNIA